MKRTRKAWLFCGIPSLMIWLMIIAWHYDKATEARKKDLANVGTYYLTQYPNCVKCRIELEEDHHYQILSGVKVIKRGVWKFVWSEDNEIVSLDDAAWLGTDEYNYDNAVFKYPNK